ncbi:MAG TPA: Tex-like N-terminal domain-containing protein, partial [Salinimicrobium sp.]|nr:Tex-like N-terminal domain-containing protein [Salinimicrobium sp.]
MTIIEFITSKTLFPQRSIVNTLNLFNEDATVPFIARYRKELTGNLDEVAIGEIQKYKTEFEIFEKRKKSILKLLHASDELTPDLKQKIESAATLVELEDLYLPFKKSKKTKADVAKENGLEPLAKLIFEQKDLDVFSEAKKYVRGNINNQEEALQGAKDIVAEWINQDASLRSKLRSFFLRTSFIETKVKKKEETKDEAQKYKQYFEWSESIKKIPSHRLLAILRAENESVLKTKIAVDNDEAIRIISRVFLKPKKSTARNLFEEAIDDSFKRLLFPALSKEVIAEAKERADEEAIKVFSSNLKQLLLAPPLGQKRILAIDPGFKSGCKVVCLDEQGGLVYNETIYPHPPQKETTQAMKKIKSLVNAYGIEAIAIGNGTASRETEFFIKKIQFDRTVQVFIVNEAGASVYSASSVARKEFPNYDVTVRGSVSIGRRLADPLAELVKIDPKAIGVGQYQHDVDQNKLKSELDSVVSNCVNSVGVDVNTASFELLSNVSGIGPSLA